MAKPNFDERFPLMFQPGGADPGMPAWPPAAAPLETAGSHIADVTSPAGSPQRTDALAGATPSDAGTAGAGLPHAPAPQDAAPQDEAPHDQTAQSHVWPPLLWISALAASAVMLAAGVFALTAQYWLPSSMEMDPANFQGVQLQPWGQVIFAAAPPLLATGIGIPATLLFLASRRTAEWERALRTTFAGLAAVVGAASWIGLFATVIFPDAALKWAGGGSRGLALPWTYLVSFSGTWLSCLAVLMMAVLFVVPRRWQHPVPEQTMAEPASPSAVRGLWFGAAVVAAGLFAMFAPYMFPLATGVVTVELSEGQTSSHEDWAVSAQYLVTPLLLAGFVVLGWALVHLATAPRREPAAELDGSGVEL